MKLSTYLRALAALLLGFGALVPALASAQTPASASTNVGATVQVNTAGIVARTHDGARASVTGSSSAEVMADIAARRADHQASTTANVEGRVDAHAGQALDMRIQAFTQVSAHFASMKLLPASSLATLQASITAEISSLTALKAQIDGDTSTTTLKADAQSITKSYRVYMLVIPQDRIASGADRVIAVADQMQALSAKFAARISAAGSVDSSVTSAKADFNTKVADAITQANAAMSVTASLSPDQGDATVMASNTAALKTALADLKTAQQDLVSARADANVIVKAVAGKAGADGSVSATSTTNV